MSKIFQSIAVKDRPSSQFNGNHSVKFTAQIGKLTPTKVVNFYPGDKFRYKQSIGMTFPPLLSPAYQSLQLRQYSFRVDKHLTWSSEQLGKYLTSMGNGKPSPAQPMITADEDYWFGNALIGLVCTLDLPVYGIKHTDGNFYLQKDNLPDFLTLNHLIFEPTQKTLDFRKNFKGSFCEARIYGADPLNGLGVFNKIQFPQFKFTTNSYGVGRGKTSSETTIDNTKFIRLNSPTSDGFGLADRFIKPPYAFPNGLLESLGYPIAGFYHDEPNKIWDAFCAAKNGGGATQVNNVQDASWLLQYDVAVKGSFFNDQPSNTGALLYPTQAATMGKQITASDILIALAEFYIINGHGDGTPLTPDLEAIRPMFSFAELSDVLNYPKKQDNSPYILDGGRFTAYWMIYDNFFREPNLTSPINFEPLRVNGAHVIEEGYKSSPHFEADGADFDKVNYMFEYFGTYNLGTYVPTAARYALNAHRTLIPSKIYDRDFITATLPTTTNIEVFAPALSNEMLATLTPDGDIKQVTPNRVMSNYQQEGGADVKPIEIDRTIVSNSFISVDAFRTAEVLQMFFRDAMLSGNKPIQFVLTQFGEHSRDFRMEVPELLSIEETPIQIHEITQQSQTAELPLGTEGGKMYAVSNKDYIDVDAKGDLGYIINMCCVYPFVSIYGGLNPEIEASNAFDQLFLPQFAELGEEVLPNKYVQFTPVVKDVDFANRFDNRFGYVPRYSRFKQQTNEIHGLFVTNMKHWHMDRFLPSYALMPTLSSAFIEVQPDNRLFAVDDGFNCYGIYQCDMQFSRKISPNFYSVIG